MPESSADRTDSPRAARGRAKGVINWRLTEPFLSPQEVVVEKLVDETPTNGGKAIKWGARRWSVAFRLSVKGGNVEAIQLCRNWLDANASRGQRSRAERGALKAAALRPAAASAVPQAALRLPPKGPHRHPAHDIQLYSLIRRRKWADIKLFLAENPAFQNCPRALELCARYGTPAIASLFDFEEETDAVYDAFTYGNLTMATYFRNSVPLDADQMRHLQRTCMACEAPLWSGTLRLLLNWMHDSFGDVCASPLVLPSRRNDLLKLLQILSSCGALDPLDFIRSLLREVDNHQAFKLTVVGDFLLAPENRRHLPLLPRGLISSNIMIPVAHLLSVSALKVLRALGAIDCYFAVKTLASPSTLNSRIEHGKVLAYAWTWLFGCKAFWHDDNFLHGIAVREMTTIDALRAVYQSVLDRAQPLRHVASFNVLVVGIWHWFRHHRIAPALRYRHAIDTFPLLMAICCTPLSVSDMDANVRREFRSILSCVHYDHRILVNLAEHHNAFAAKEILEKMPCVLKSEWNPPLTAGSNPPP